jgi:IS30 family transposase
VQRRRYTQAPALPEKAGKRYGKQDHRGRITNSFSIEQRPAIVAQKSRIGDWEGG